MFSFFKKGLRDTELMKLIDASDRGDLAAKRKLNNLPDATLSDEKYLRLKRKVHITHANQGDPVAICELASIAQYYDHDTKTAERLYLQAAEHKNTQAMLALGRGYSDAANEKDMPAYYGFGADEKKECKWLTAAANLNDCEAQNALALYYACLSDYDKSIYWYQRALQTAKEQSNYDKYFTAAIGLSGEYDKQITRNADVADKKALLEKSKQLLISVLTFHQTQHPQLSDPELTALSTEYKHLHGIHMSDYSDHYEHAAFSLGWCFLFETAWGAAQDNKRCNRAAAYCFALAYIQGDNSFAKDKMLELNDYFNDTDWNHWSDDALRLKFNLPR